MKKEMKTIAELIKELQAFPPESHCYVYEGECFGVVLINEHGKKVGFVDCDYDVWPVDAPKEGEE
jgi:hypothetical protein